MNQSNIDTVQELTIKDIDKELKLLFKNHKIPWLTSFLDMAKMHNWADKYSAKLGIDKDRFKRKVAAVFWAVGHTQLSLGYLLISLKSIKYKDGMKGTVYNSDKVPIAMEVPDVHFWFHATVVIECIYRSWERLKSMLIAVTYPKKGEEKYYFNTLIVELDKDSLIKKDIYFKSLKKHEDNWNNIANHRNEFSHGDSSPINKMTINGKVTNLYGFNNERILKMDYGYESPQQEYNKLKQYYEKLLPLMQDVQAFIEGYS